MHATRLVLLYAFFAIIATLANLLTQRMVLSISRSDIFFFIAVACGTLVGLVIKYSLDKKWIFYDKSAGVRAHSKKFGLYTFMGAITTMIFWGTETVFWLTWRTEFMRELGAIIGLTIGYTIKYPLDKRYVFTNAHMEHRL